MDRNEAISRVIVAVDVPSMTDAQVMLDGLKGRVGLAKVGLQLISRYGTGASQAIRNMGYGIMHDAKLHDIPNTVEAAVKSILPSTPVFITMHASSGAAAIKKAVEACRGTETRMIGVTVLTSLSPEECEEIYGEKPDVKVPKFVHKFVDNGGEVVVCSPLETEAILRLYPHLTLINPGVRLPGKDARDQQRISTPTIALENGAKYVVLGGQYTDPATKLKKAAEAEGHSVDRDQLLAAYEAAAEEVIEHLIAA